MVDWIVAEAATNGDALYFEGGVPCTRSPAARLLSAALLWSNLASVVDASDRNVTVTETLRCVVTTMDVGV